MIVSGIVVVAFEGRGEMHIEKNVDVDGDEKGSGVVIHLAVVRKPIKQSKTGVNHGVSLITGKEPRSVSCGQPSRRKRQDRGECAGKEGGRARSNTDGEIMGISRPQELKVVLRCSLDSRVTGLGPHGGKGGRGCGNVEQENAKSKVEIAK